MPSGQETDWTYSITTLPGTHNGRIKGYWKISHATLQLRITVLPIIINKHFITWYLQPMIRNTTYRPMFYLNMPSIRLSFRCRSSRLHFNDISDRLTVWLSGNALVSINVVTLRWARLVPGWVTVFGRVNYLSMLPATQVNSARPSLRG